MRGAKGITFAEGDVLIANHSQIFRFDDGWRPKGVVTHPSCSGIHDILYANGSLWVTSSRNDLVFEFDLDGNVKRFLNMRAHPEVAQRLAWRERNLLDDESIETGRIDFRDPRTHRYETYDGAHVNSVAVLPSGDVLVMMGIIWTRSMTSLFTLKKYLKKSGLWKPLVGVSNIGARLFKLEKPLNSEMAFQVATGKSAVVRFHTNGEVSVPFIVPNTNTPVHSLMAQADGTAFFNDTDSGNVVHFDPDTGETLSRTDVGEAFLRGIARVSQNQVVVGGVQNAFLVDTALRQVVDSFRLSENPNETVYDIKVLPSTFDRLPDRLSPVNAESTARHS
jgi:hypothetical protein